MNAIALLPGSLNAQPRPADCGRNGQRLWMPAGRVKAVRQRGLTLRCLTGRVWLTEIGSGRDVILTTGDYYVCGGGKVVVEGLVDAMLCLDGQTQD